MSEEDRTKSVYVELCMIQYKITSMLLTVKNIDQNQGHDLARRNFDNEFDIIRSCLDKIHAEILELSLEKE